MGDLEHLCKYYTFSDVKLHLPSLKPSEIIGQDLFEIILSHVSGIGFFDIKDNHQQISGRYPVSNIINVQQNLVCTCHL